MPQTKTRTCGYSHHEEYGEPVPDCPDCGEQMYCGPFHHRCRNCDPFWFRRCGICGVKRIYCSC